MNSNPGPLTPLLLVPLLLFRFNVISGTELLFPLPLFRFRVTSGAEPLLPLSTFMTSSGADPPELPCDRLRMISGTEFPLLVPRFRTISGDELAEGVLSAGEAGDDALVAVPEFTESAGAELVPDVADAGEPLLGGIEEVTGAGGLLPALLKLTMISAMVLPLD